MLTEFADWALVQLADLEKLFLRFVAGFSMFVIDKS